MFGRWLETRDLFAAFQLQPWTTVRRVAAFLCCDATMRESHTGPRCNNEFTDASKISRTLRDAA